MRLVSIKAIKIYISYINQIFAPLFRPTSQLRSYFSALKIVGLYLSSKGTICHYLSSYFNNTYVSLHYQPNHNNTLLIQTSKHLARRLIFNF